MTGTVKYHARDESITITNLVQHYFCQAEEGEAKSEGFVDDFHGNVSCRDFSLEH